MVNLNTSSRVVNQPVVSAMPQRISSAKPVRVGENVVRASPQVSTNATLVKAEPLRMSTNFATQSVVGQQVVRSQAPMNMVNYGTQPVVLNQN